MCELLTKIERVRSHLNRVIMQGKSLVDYDVICISHELDMLLNKYYEMMQVQGNRRDAALRI